MLRNTVLVVTTSLFACAAARAQPPAAVLQLERQIALPDVQGRIDHLAADVAGKRVFVSALGNGTVEIVDFTKGQRTGQIKGLKEPQGVAFVPSNGALYVASGGDGSVRSFDSHTLKPLQSVALGEDADNLRFDAQHSQLLAGYGSGAIAALGLDLSRRTNSALPVHPESFQLGADGSHIYVNLPDNKTIGSIDTAAQSVNPAWTHLSATGNFPMVVDESVHRIIVACRKPARLMVINSLTGGITSWFPTVGDADDLFLDSTRPFIYVIGGDGFIDVLQLRAADSLINRGRIPTAPGARTGLYIPEWNKLIVAAPASASEGARLLVFSTAP
jgi:DNA-binding beta-propeller fold protein YncE